MTASLRQYQVLDTWVQHGATNHLLVDGPQQIKKPLQSVILLVQANPILVQHKQVAAPAEDVSSPQASLVLASYCSEDFHIPEGTVRSHTVQRQEQQMLQQGHAQKKHLQPRRVWDAQEPHTFVELQQVVVDNPNVVVHVGPMILAFPGYALLLILVGLNGAMSYTSVDAIPTGCGNTSVINL